jgi:hypothetical protein
MKMTTMAEDRNPGVQPISAAKDRCRQLLRLTSPSAEVIGDDAAFLRDLLQRHPAVAAKVGAGIAHFTVEPRILGASRRRHGGSLRRSIELDIGEICPLLPKLLPGTSQPSMR